MWGQVCSGKNAVLQPDRLGRGRRPVHRQAGRLRRLRLGAEGRSGRQGRGALRRQPGVEPSAGVRPGRDGLQRRRRRQAGRRTATCSPRSSRARSRSGTTRPSPRSTPARPCPTPTSRRSTARTPRAPPTTSRSTLAPPRRRAWTKGAGKEFQGGAGEGAQKSAGVVQAIQATPGAIGYVEKGFAAAGRPARWPRSTAAAGAVELTDESAEQGRSTPPSSRARATT